MPFDVQCLGAKARTVRGDPRQDIPADTIGSKGRLHHRAGSSSRYRRPGVEDITGDGAKSVESRLCQDGHASPKRACRAAFASRVTDSRLIQISRWKRRANSLSVFKPRASGVARVRRVTGFFSVRGDGHPSGVIPHRNRRHHHVGSCVDHRNIVVGLHSRRARRCTHASTPDAPRKAISAWWLRKCSSSELTAREIWNAVLAPRGREKPRRYGAMPGTPLGGRCRPSGDLATKNNCGIRTIIEATTT